MSRARSAPPVLPGFTEVKAIGGGGFADVFLYTQLRPSRQVAIKVLRSEHLSQSSLRQFEHEADVMAEVSTHPYIVTIYSTGMAPDGRPYIAMEYYPQPHFGLRARGATLAVPEVLRVGVQVSSAVETAHRAGILHRDIKPANILTSAYGRPGLTDFGIAGVARDDRLEDASGVSIAFASPEALSEDGAAGTVASDVYSLGATLFALLAGRSPRWIPGGDNTDAGLLARGLSGSVPRLVRDDMPASFVNLLHNALAPDPSARPPSALAFARGLQDVEQELRLPTTSIEVEQDGPPIEPRRRYHDDEDGTRRARPRVVSDEPPESATAARTPAAAPIIAATPVAGSSSEVDDSETVLRRPTVEAETSIVDIDPAQPADRPAKRRARIYLGVAAAVIVGIIVAGSLATRADRDASSATTTVQTFDPGVGIASPAPPTDVEATVDDSGVLAVTFVPPVDSAGVTFRMQRVDPDDPNRPPLAWPGGGTTEAKEVSGSPTTVDGFKPGERVCVQIVSTRDQLTSEPAGKCSSSG